MEPESISPAIAELLAGSTVCRVWAEQDEGPYHRDDPPGRREVVEDRLGRPLRLGLRLLGAGGHPVGDAALEIWHCDALGRYSGFPPPRTGAPTSASVPRIEYVPERTFLRGRQTTDDTGTVEFQTIYPGWYPGRTVHIHAMAHVGGRRFITQLYFPEELNAEVLATPPYDERPGRDTTNEVDEIFPTGGPPAVLEIRPEGEGFVAAACLLLGSLGGGSVMSGQEER